MTVRHLPSMASHVLRSMGMKRRTSPLRLSRETLAHISAAGRGNPPPPIAKSGQPGCGADTYKGCGETEKTGCNLQAITQSVGVICCY
jgi:hypothetical protein